MRYVRFILTGAAVLGVGSVMVDAWLSRRPVTVARTLCHAFASGYVPAEAERKDTATVVARPVLDKQLQRLLRPLEVDNYALVVGAHGTGKSTAVRKAAREAPSEGTDGASTSCNGVVYFSIDDPQTFSKDLCEVLGFKHGTVDMMEAGRRRLMVEEGKNAEPASTEEPQASWRPLAVALKSAAMEFRSKHGRPMTLIIDNIQDMLQAKPAFVTVLQKFAKAEADHGNLRVVFVSSDFTALTHMMARSEGSRCKSMEIGEADISEAEAVKYITAKLRWAGEDKDKVAKYIVEHITGTRFSLLNSVEADHSTMAAAQAWEVTLHDKTVATLRSLNVRAGHSLFSCMLGAPFQKLRNGELIEVAGITDEQCEALVKVNVLAAHVDGTYTCGARHVVESFKRLRVAPTAPVSAAAASTTAASSSVCG